jgi:mRNA interferase RelE/StbE
MNWTVLVQRSAKKELAALSSEMQVRIARALRALETEPFPANSKRLRGRDDFRLRVGDYRILYTVDHQSRTLSISAIGHRREVYR